MAERRGGGRNPPMVLRTFLWSHAPATQCPVPACTVLRACYAVSGTATAHPTRSVLRSWGIGGEEREAVGELKRVMEEGSTRTPHRTSQWDQLYGFLSLISAVSSYALHTRCP
eukprot:3731364-Rhodomonas_salina.1